MSNRRPASSLFFHFAITVFTLVALLAPSTAHAAACAGEVPLDLNTTWQDAGQAIGDASCFTISLETFGALAVDLYTAPDASAARLELHTIDGSSRLRPVSPQHVYGLVSPGRVLIRVLSVDRHQPLDPFRLQVRFVPVDALGKGELDDELEAEPDPFTGGGQCAKGELDDELEAEPDPFTGGGQCSKGELDDELEAEPDPFTGGGQCAKGELDDELEAEPDPLWSPVDLTVAKGELDDELEAEPDPFTGGGLQWRTWRSASKVSLCGTGSEDLADDLLCARRWTPGCGHDVLHLTSELRSAWGDDHDVVRIELDGPSTLTVSARGEVELTLRLDDARGQRLDRVSGDGDGVRLVRSLAAGTYFLRLAGQHGAEGAYTLRIETERH